MGQGDDQGWTADQVEARLVAAFRALPQHPVFSRAGRVRVDGSRSATEALNWPSMFLTDNRERQMLMAWARCRATKASSFGAVCSEMDWPRNTAEVGRRRAAKAIAAALAVEAKLGLDNGKARPGFSGNDAGDPTRVVA